MKKLILALFSVAFLETEAQVNLTSSLTACYALDGSANDPVSSLNGTLSVVTPTVDRFNNANSSYYFNGTSSSFIGLPNSVLLKPNAVTVSAWVMPSLLTNGALVIFAKNNLSSYFTSYCLAIEISNGWKFKVYRQYSSTNDVVISTTNVSQNVWYHVVFSIDNASMKIYVNGILENTIVPTITSFNYDPTRGVILGGTNETNYNVPYTGFIDNVRFYNRILTAGEVSTLYAQDPSCNPLPNSSFSVSPPSICAGGSIVMTDVSSNSPTSWNWQIQGTNTSSSSVNNPTVTFQNPGTYTIALTSSNGSGAGNTATQTVVVFPNPLVTIASNNIFCNGLNNTLTAQGASTYTWSTNQTGQSITINPTQNSTYTVIGQGINGCKSTAQINVTVSQLPILTISGNTVICEGASTSLLLGGTAATYTWSTGSSGNLITVSPSVSTIYTVSGTGNGGCINSAVQVIQVNTNPPVIAFASHNPLCIGDALILSGSGASTYTWTGGITNNVAFYPTTSATYTVTGTGTNSCKGSTTVQVAVNPNPVLTLLSSTSLNICPGQLVTLSASGANTYSWSTGNITPQINITPTITSNYTVTGIDANGCKATSVFIQIVDACLGIQKIESENAIQLFPNPFSTEINIVMKNILTDVSIEVYNVAGEKTGNYKLNSSSTSLKLNECAEGIYFIKVYSGNKLIKQEKLIKRSN